jgi:hypothetical protein
LLLQDHMSYCLALLSDGFLVLTLQLQNFHDEYRQSIADNGIRCITSAIEEFTNSEFLQTVIPAYAILFSDRGRNRYRSLAFLSRFRPLNATIGLINTIN